MTFSYELGRPSLHFVKNHPAKFPPGCRFRSPSRERGQGRAAPQLVGDRHLGDDHLAVVSCGTPQHPHRPAQRHEFGIALDVGDEAEHIGGGVLHAALWWRTAEGGRSTPDSGPRRRPGWLPARAAFSGAWKSVYPVVACCLRDRPSWGQVSAGAARAGKLKLSLSFTYD
jgi:hypothetical protein